LKLPDASVIPTINVPLGSFEAGSSFAAVVSSPAGCVSATSGLSVELHPAKNAVVTITKQRNKINDFFILDNPPS
jgi:hypothetical protein